MMRERLSRRLLRNARAVYSSGRGAAGKLLDKGKEVLSDKGSGFTSSSSSSSAGEGIVKKAFSLVPEFKGIATAREVVALTGMRERIIRALAYQEPDQIVALFPKEMRTQELISEAGELCEAFADPVLSFDTWMNDAKGSGLKIFEEYDEISGVFCVRSAAGSYYFHIRGILSKVGSGEKVTYIKQIDLVPEKAEALWEAGKKGPYAGEDPKYDGIRVISDDGITFDVRRIDGMPLPFTEATRSMTQTDVIDYVQGGGDLSIDAFLKKFGEPNASRNGAYKDTRIRNGTRYYYQLDEAEDLFAELTVADGEIVLVRRLQSWADVRELVPTGSKQEKRFHEVEESASRSTYCRNRLLEALDIGDKDMAREIFSDFAREYAEIDEGIDRLFDEYHGPVIREAPGSGMYGYAQIHGIGVRFDVEWPDMVVETAGEQYEFKLKVGKRDTDSEEYNHGYSRKRIGQLDVISGAAAAAFTNGLTSREAYRSWEKDIGDDQINYGIHFQEEPAEPVESILIHGTYYIRLQGDQEVSLEDVLNYCKDGSQMTADAFREHFGQPIAGDTSYPGSFYYRITGADVTFPYLRVSQDYFSGNITRIDVCAMRGAVEINYYKNY
jgi:hypothetical protein